MTRKVIKQIEKDYWEEKADPVDMVEIFDLAQRALEQEPKTGHWNEIPKYKDIAWQCSKCEHFTTMKHNYCPNCGADMRGEE